MNLNRKQYDEINEVESWLYNYKSIKIGIENLKVEYEENKDITIGSADPSKETIITNKFNSSVENTIISSELLDNRVKYMENKIRKIDKALSSLSKEEYIVINNYYIEGKHIYEFTHEVNTSESTCKRIKKRALNKIRIALYGLRVN